MKEFLYTSQTEHLLIISKDYLLKDCFFFETFKCDFISLRAFVVKIFKAIW